MHFIKYLKRLIYFFSIDYEKNKLNIEFGKYIATTGHLFYWFLWTYVFPQEYDSAFVRFTAIVLFIPFFITKIFPNTAVIRALLGVYWYICLGYNLPYLFTYMMLMNNFSDIWLICETMAILMTLILAPRIVMFLITFGFGAIFAYLSFIFQLGSVEGGIGQLEYLFVIPMVIVGGILFNYSAKYGEFKLELLEQKNKSFKSLAGSIAHEMRNPLGAIKLATENMSSTKERVRKNIELEELVNSNSDLKELIEDRSIEIANFKRQINKTIDLARSVIDMTLHELGGKKFTKEDFSYYSAYKAVMDAVTIYGYSSNEQKEKVIIDLDNRKIVVSNAEKEDISITNLDKNNNFLIKIEDTAFKYMIFNLIKNALFYLKDYPDAKITIDFEKEKTIDLALINRFKLNPNITKYNIINVTDTGPGIADDIITKIFDSYFTSGKKGGTGVGLDFCQRMMNDFDGGIICQSEVGKYTNFSLLFPILNKEEEKEAIKEITKIENEKHKALKAGMSLEEAENLVAKKPTKNILLVDDVKLNIEILSKDLKGKCSNFNITIINDPVKAFELIKSKEEENKQFDLILTDIEMPEVDGVELTNKVRNDLKLSKDNLPILAYSSREKRQIIDQALEAGCNHYYTKPKDLRFIARNIAKWVLDDYIPNKNSNHEEIIIDNNSFTDKNIIIADDQLVNLMTISRQFQEKGANVTKCKDGKDIINLIEQNPTKYHLIITDINMEEIGGIEATKKVRAIEKEYNSQQNNQNNQNNNNNKTKYKTPIIAISGDSHKSFVMNMLNSGIDDYLTKGCSGEDMAKLSRFWIDYYHQDQESSLQDNQEATKTASSNNKQQSNAILKSDFNELFSNQEEKDELINIFETESNIIITEIINAKNNIESLRKAIHKIKGSSGSIGANKLFQYTSKINNLLQQEKTPEDKDFSKKIKEMLDEAIKEMKK
ncbi:response regulator [Rickettsiales bacterium]|nr:response regulator [Rickettsiales bacterium]